MRLRVLELAVPRLLDARDRLVAEVEPALKLGPLLDALHVILFVLAAVLLVELLLGQVTQLESDLADLAEIHAACVPAGRIVEVAVRFQLRLHEVFHRLEVGLVERLPDQVEHEQALLVRDRAELESAHHEEHRLDDLLAKAVAQDVRLSHGSALGKHRQKGSKVLDRADTEHASLADLSAALVTVSRAKIATPHDDQTVVAQVVEVGHQQLDALIFLALKRVCFLLRGLSNDLGQEVQCVDLVLRVCIHAADDSNDFLQSLRLGQQLEECFVFAKIVKHLACIERHVQLVTVLGREHVDELVDNHRAFLLKYRLHAFLVRRELLLGVVLLGLDIQVAVVAGVPLVFLLGLDLLFDQFNE